MKKKSKGSQFARQQKHLNKEASQAMMAIRELYPDSTFQEHFEETVRTVLEKSMGEESLPPAARIRLFPKDNILVVFQEFPEFANKRRLAYQQVGERMGNEDKNIVAIHSWAEAWMAKNIDGDNRAPSQREDKKEVLVITAMTVDGREMGASFEVHRDSNNRIQNLTGRENMEFNNGNGNLLHHSFFAGYAHAKRDQFLKKLLNK